MRVLVIEDDRELAEAIGIGLRRERLAVDVAFDGQAGLEQALVTGYDVVVLDRFSFLSVPEVEADRVVEALRERRLRGHPVRLERVG